MSHGCLICVCFCGKPDFCTRELTLTCAVWILHSDVRVFVNHMTLCAVFVVVKSSIITGPPTHSVGGQTSNGHWRLASSSVVVCNTSICNVTDHGAAGDGGPVVLRPVRATPCSFHSSQYLTPIDVTKQNEGFYFKSVLLAFSIPA